MTRQEVEEASGTHGGMGNDVTVHINDVGQVIVYTDGGCTNPQYGNLRRAVCGIYFAGDHAWNQSEALTGIEQTVGRV